jgi:membrane-bound lytic murein transglycosylase B
MAELNAKGVTIREKIQLPQDEKFTFIQLQGKNGPEYWVGTTNFYAIMRYNPRVMYAMAVYQLSQEIAQLKG